MSVNHLQCYYKDVIHPVNEYACPLWHSGITKRQYDQLKILKGVNLA